MTDRTLDEAMGMDIAPQLRETVGYLGRHRRCAHCHRPLPHTEPEQRACPSDACECWPTPEHMHFVYYGATEPGSAMEWNPDCPVHRPHDGATT